MKDILIDIDWLDTFIYSFGFVVTLASFIGIPIILILDKITEHKEMYEYYEKHIKNKKVSKK